ncbi:hypothetical protein MMC25_001700 [Agyrium rufum]|nr:hypothetical protein [Agyrium rufum]
MSATASTPASQPLPLGGLTLRLHTLPKQWSNREEFLDLVTKFRTFRLQCLQLAPDSFATTYAQEILYSQERWEERVKDPTVTVIVAITSHDRTNARSQEKAHDEREVDWVGLIAVLEHDSEVRIGDWVIGNGKYTGYWYKLNALFVHPRARRTGLGKKLIQASLDCIAKQAEGRGLAKVKVVLLTDQINVAAVGLYEGFGFKVVDEHAYAIGNDTRNAITLERDVKVST